MSKPRTIVTRRIPRVGLELVQQETDARVWDSQDGKNHRLELSMLLRGWQNYLAVGISANPHGGIGYL